MCTKDADCAPKEDGDACNGTLYCAKGTGKCAVNPATIVACPTAGDSACANSVCAPATGICAPKFAVDGTGCDDGALCTSGDACLAGNCVGSAATCPCASDSECTAKDDGDLCNGVMFCNKAKGTCEINPATVVTCQTGLDTTCVKHVCQAKIGKCEAVAAVESTPCDADGNGCTVADHCAAGVCQPGTDVCACKSDAECAKQDDGDLCNGTMYCDKTSGNCLLNPKTVVKCGTVADTACKKNACDPLSGKCAMAAIHEFQACDADGLLCTLNDQCKGGECKPGANICECLGDSDCKDDGDLCNGTPYCDKAKPLFTCTTNAKTVVVCAQTGQPPCSTSSCIAKTGLCTTTLGQDGLDCDDGTACTLGDACKKGSCLPALAIDCDDGNGCTLDGCEGGKCVSVAATVALPCASSPGYCQGGKCLPPPASCLALQTAAPGVRSGVFHLDPDGSGGPGVPFAAWCDQSSQGGGWTLVLKGSPTTQTFIYDSPQWFSPSVLGAGSPGYDDTEAKLASYAHLPLKELRVGMLSGGVVRSVTFDADGPSLLALMKTSVASKLGPAAWLGLTPGVLGGWLDYTEGVNPPVAFTSKVLIGIAFVISSNSGAVGFGCFGAVCGNNNVVPVGGIQCSPFTAKPAFGYVFAR